jgi:glycosyltransferase involved in cell wall biosynthesis
MISAIGCRAYVFRSKKTSAKFEGIFLMQLDVVVPTYNRSASLERAVKSLLTSPIPEGNQVRVIVVDNRSTDATRSVVERLMNESSGRVLYVAENRNQGRSFALNAGIANATAELIGFIDDDEEIDKGWFQVIFTAFSDPSVDFIGGPYHPQWPMTPPDWLDHPHTRCAIGWADFGDVRRQFEDDFDALLMGGNSILRRTCFDKVGVYSTSLGRTAKRLLAGEDADMHARLIAAGLRGFYHPDLIIHHHISADRMKKSYMRSWAFWASASDGYGARVASPKGAIFLGLPRYVYRKTLGAPLRWGKALLASHGAANAFHEELTLWRFAGLFYGRNFMSRRTISG